MAKMHYKELSTEKYWVEAMKVEAIQVRKWQRQQTMQSIVNTITAVSMAAIAFMIGISSNSWMPQLMSWVEEVRMMAM